MIDLSEFFEIQSRLMSDIPSTRRLEFLEKINWDVRLLGIIGARGTGKTTLLLQHLSDLKGRSQDFLYISADHVPVQAQGLYEIGSTFFKLGGKLLLIDEIHKFTDWSREVKSLYDSHPKARIVFSGSSTLALQKGTGDLSRRSVLYSLPGLSFREYLFFAEGIDYSSVTLSEIIEKHADISSEIVRRGPVLGYFRDYLDHGVYPYFLEGIAEYLPRLLNVLEKVFYEDIPTAIGTKISNIPILKRMLWLIATSQPFIPNIERMSRDLKISKELVYTFLDTLERARLLTGISPVATGYRLVRKPSKMYLENPNLLAALAGHGGGEAMRGTIRETFFAQQVRGAGLPLHIPPKGDLLVERKYLFEIGGKSKDSAQIIGENDAFVLRDDVEVGYRNIMPLWVMGFLY